MAQADIGANVRRSEFDESAVLERTRLAWLESARGRNAALAFARRTQALYRHAVVRRHPPAGSAHFRLRMIASYCQFKRYLADAPTAPVPLKEREHMATRKQPPPKAPRDKVEEASWESFPASDPPAWATPGDDRPPPRRRPSRRR